MKYRHIFFDLDGTITDSGPGIMKSVQYALKKYGIDEPDPENLKSFVGPPLNESFHERYGFGEKDYEGLLKAYREYYNVRGIYENAVYPGVEKLLGDLNAAGLNCYIATTKPARPTGVVLSYFSLSRYFKDVSCGSDEPDKGKKGYVIRMLMEKNEITDRDSAVMIGDRSHDMIGAAENGIHSFGVLYGYGSSGELKDAGAEKLVSSAEEIADCLL
jgi:phosphoglycolate phosphatase